jgi:hypothetical protein
MLGGLRPTAGSNGLNRISEIKKAKIPANGAAKTNPLANIVFIPLNIPENPQLVPRNTELRKFSNSP